VSRPGGWQLEERAGSARALHEPWPPAELAQHRIFCRCEVTGPSTLVLGSGQRDSDGDLASAARAGVDVVRRASGGGAVLVAPGEQLWLDAWIPRGDALWEEDVVRSAWWLGDAWAAALERVGAPAPHVHRDRAQKTTWSDRVCFAGIGPGEVSVGGHKVVGISQRRTRAGARMTSVAMLRWDPARLLSLLALSDDERRRAAAELGPRAEGLQDVFAGADQLAGLLDVVAAEVTAQLP
jgi:lipoate-protein ligase A